MRLQRRFLPIVISAAAIIGATPLIGEEFYEAQLRQGRAAMLAGRPLDGAELCRIASFGLMDNPPRLIESIICFALASAESGRDGDVPAALERFVEVETRFPSYRAATIDDTFRRSFDALLRENIAAERLQAIPSLASLTAPTQPKRDVVAETKRPARTRRGGEAPAPQVAETTPDAPPPQQTAAPRSVAAAASKPAPPPATVSPEPVTRSVPAATSSTGKSVTPEPQRAVTPPPRSATVKPETSSPPSPQPEAQVPTRKTNEPKKIEQQPRSEPVQSLARRPAAAEDTILAQGRRLIRNRRLGEAERFFYAELTKQPERRDLRLALLEAATLYGDWDTAVSQTRLLEPFGDGEETAMFYAAAALYERGRMAEAKKYIAMARPQLRMRPYVKFYVERIEAVP